MLKNVGSERAILAGICQHGVDAHVDVADIISANTFTIPNNQMIYRCLCKIFDGGAKEVDLSTIIATSSSLNYHELISLKDKDVEYLRSLFNFPIKLTNVRQHAKSVMILEIARTAQAKHKEAHESLSAITGDENIDTILSMSEKPSVELYDELNARKEDRPELLHEGLDERLERLMDDPIENIGIPTPFPVFNELIGGGLRSGVTLIAARPKCQPLSAKVLTPSGWIRYSDIVDGQEVCNPDGGVSKVVQVFETGKKPVFKFTFDDGSSTLACSDHRWKVKSRRWQEYKTLSLTEMSLTCLIEQDRPKWKMPITKSVTFNKKEHLIDPYMMGVLIAEGCLSKGLSFSSGDKFVVDKIQQIIKKHGYKVKKRGKSQCDYNICKEKGNQVNIFYREIKRLGLNKLSIHKFIPKEYIYDSHDNRMKLLNGLLDGDAHVGKNGSIEYYTSSSLLRDDFIDLVRSLGGKCKYKVKKTYANDCYRIRTSFNDNRNVFSLPRKKQRCKLRTKPDIKRSLVDIDYVGEMETRCIKVDNENEMYITDDYIVTKNTGKTTLAKDVALHTSGLGVKTLVLDTEMNKDDMQNRALASISGVQTRLIETGKFGMNPTSRNKVLKAAEHIKGLADFYHKKIGGKEFSEVLSIIRRWLYREVGFDEFGNPNPHVVIYDYFKLMTSESIKDMQEYQALGFQISKLTDFCQEYNTPVMAFVQVNRDGLTKESSDIISQSDRLLWLCISASLFKRKTADEIAADGPQNGNMKLIPLECRFGAPLDEGDYINMDMQGDLSKIRELNTRTAALKNNNTGFDISDDNSSDDEL